MLRALSRQAARSGINQWQQQNRAFAEKAVAAGINWDTVAEAVHSDEGKRELASLRSTFFDIQQRLEAMAQKTSPPDWNAWKKELDPKIVDGFKQAFETMKLPTYDGNDEAEATAKFNELIKQAEALAASSAARVKEIQAELVNIEKEKQRIVTTTIDQELAADPKLAAEVDADIEKNSFLVTP